MIEVSGWFFHFEQGLDRKVVEIFLDYMTETYVYPGQTLFPILEVTSGVPVCSVFGPLLFMILINLIVNIFKNL
jgi:hypothetical protein